MCESVRGDAAQPIVTGEDICEVVAMWTGIPVTRIAQEESERLLQMEDALHKRVIGQQEAIETERRRLSEIWLTPRNAAGREAAELLDEPISKEIRAIDLLKRPGMTYRRLAGVEGIGARLTEDDWAVQLEIELRYSGYVDRQGQEIERRRRKMA